MEQYIVRQFFFVNAYNSYVISIQSFTLAMRSMCLTGDGAIVCR